MVSVLVFVCFFCFSFSRFFLGFFLKRRSLLLNGESGSSEALIIFFAALDTFLMTFLHRFALRFSGLEAIRIPLFLLMFPEVYVPWKKVLSASRRPGPFIAVVP